MGEAVDRLQENLVALSGLSRVKAYTRKSKTGQTVQVAAHTRAVDKMNFKELSEEFQNLKGSAAPQDRNRLAQVVTRMRDKFGHGPEEEFDASKVQAIHKKKMQDASGREEGYDFSNRNSRRRKGASGG